MFWIPEAYLESVLNRDSKQSCVVTMLSAYAFCYFVIIFVISILLLFVIMSLFFFCCFADDGDGIKSDYKMLSKRSFADR